jgi:hypothetical protein
LHVFAALRTHFPFGSNNTLTYSALKSSIAQRQLHARLLGYDTIGSFNSHFIKSPSESGCDCVAELNIIILEDPTPK